VVVGEQGAVVADEVEQARHLLEIGGDVRVVAAEMRVVELDVDDVLDVAARRLELTTAGSIRRCGGKQRDDQRGQREPWTQTLHEGASCRA